MNVVLADAPDKADAVASLVERAGVDSAVFVGDVGPRWPVVPFAARCQGTLRSKCQRRLKPDAPVWT